MALRRCWWINTVSERCNPTISVLRNISVVPIRDMEAPMKILFLLFFTFIQITFAKNSSNIPSVKEVIAWNKKTPTLAKIISQNGWPKTKSFSRLPGSSFHENKRQSNSLILLYKRMGSLKADETLVIHGKRECNIASSGYPGSELKENFDPKTETFSCWVRKAATSKTKIEINFFLQMRSVVKGSKYFNIYATEIPVDELKPQPSSSGRAIASKLEVVK
jgi:hypothetical protein